MSAKRKSIIVVIFLIWGINLAGHQLFRFFKIDLSPTKAYTLTKKSKSLVANLKNQLRIKVFLTPDMATPNDTIGIYLRELLADYGRYGGDKFTYEFYDVKYDSKDEKIKENAELAHSYGLRPVELESYTEGRVTKEYVYKGVVIEYGVLVENIYNIESVDGLELEMTEILSKMLPFEDTIQSLTEKIQYEIYIDPNALSKIGGVSEIELENKLKSIYEENNKILYGAMEFKLYKDYKKDEDIIKELQYLGGYPFDRDSQVSAETSFLAMILRYKERSILINLAYSQLALTDNGLAQVYQLNNLDTLSQYMPEIIMNVITDLPKIGILEKNSTTDEYNSINGYASFIVEVERFYSLERVAPLDIQSKELTTLIIPGYIEYLSQEELFEIDQFIMRGGKALFFYDKLGPGGRSESQNNLDQLLSSYGITVTSDFILDTSSLLIRDEARMYASPVVSKKNITDISPYKIFSKRVVLNNVSGLFLTESAQSNTNIKATPLLVSSEEAWLSRDIDIYRDDYANRQRQELERQVPKIAYSYLLEGTFESAFTDILTSSHVYLEKSLPTSIYVLGSSRPLRNELFSRERFAENIVYFMSMLDYIGGDPGWIEMRNKIHVNSYIQTPTTDNDFIHMIRQPNTVKYLTTFLLVVLVLVFYIWMRVMRKRRQKWIMEKN